MKLTNLLIIGSSLILFISPGLKAQTTITTEGGTTVKTIPGGGINISTEKRTVDLRSDDQNENDDSLSDRDNQRTTCHQENYQSSTITDSNRTVVQSSTSRCN
jgi:hypothetical protein